MAVIGEMQYLTIGDKTYSIPSSGGSTVAITQNLTSGTKSATITVDGTAYDIYSTNNSGGTVTSVRVQATSPVQSSTSTAQSSTLNTTISLANAYGDTKNPYGTKTANYILAGPSSGSAAAPSFRALVAADIPDLSGTYLTSYTETDPVFSASAAAGITSSDITNWNNKSNLTLGTTATTAAKGNHTHTTTLATDTGTSSITLASASKYKLTAGGTGVIFTMPTIPTVPTNVSAFTNDAGYITSADVPEGASAYTGTISEVGTTASSGTNNGFARGDHVHNITKTTVDSILGINSDTTKFYRGDGTWASPNIPTSMDGYTDTSYTRITIDDHPSTTIYGVGSSTTTASKVTVGSHSTDYGVRSAGSGSFTQGSFSGGSGSFSATVLNHVLSFSHTHTAATHGEDSHSHTAPTLGSKIPTVSASDITVPIKNSSTTTVITNGTHTINDNGHNHEVEVDTTPNEHLV